MAVVVKPHVPRVQPTTLEVGNSTSAGLLPVGVVTLEDIIEEVS